jgi:hypothetical protein
MNGEAADDSVNVEAARDGTNEAPNDGTYQCEDAGASKAKATHCLKQNPQLKFGC